MLFAAVALGIVIQGIGVVALVFDSARPYRGIRLITSGAAMFFAAMGALATWALAGVYGPIAILAGPPFFACAVGAVWVHGRFRKGAAT